MTIYSADLFEGPRPAHPPPPSPPPFTLSSLVLIAALFMRGPANKHMNARGLSRETRPSTHAHDGPGPRHCLVLLTAGRTIYLGCPSRTASWNIYRHLRERTGCHRGLWTTRAHAHGRFGVTFFLDGDERTGQRRVLNGPGDWDFGGWGIFSRRWERDPGIIRGSISGDTSLSKDTKS